MKTAENIEDLIERPEDYGFVSFEDFRRNKEKWMGRPDDEVAAIDRGDPVLGIRQKYYVQDNIQYRVDSLEQAERIAHDMGLSLHHDFMVDPQIQDDDGIYTKVTFRSKRSIERRSKW